LTRVQEAAFAPVLRPFGSSAGAASISDRPPPGNRAHVVEELAFGSSGDHLCHRVQRFEHVVRSR
jgi:hypothetical protein